MFQLTCAINPFFRDYSLKFTENKSERDKVTYQVSLAKWQYLDLNSGCEKKLILTWEYVFIDF